MQSDDPALISRFDALMRAALQQTDIASYELCLNRVAAIARDSLAEAIPDPSAREQAVQECLQRAHKKRHTFGPGQVFDDWAAMIIQRQLATPWTGAATRTTHGGPPPAFMLANGSPRRSGLR